MNPDESSHGELDGNAKLRDQNMADDLTVIITQPEYLNFNFGNESPPPPPPMLSRSGGRRKKTHRKRKTVRRKTHRKH